MSILFYQPQISDNIHHLDPEESRHCIKVLRRKRGDEINITDGKGYFYTATIKDDNPHQCSFSITGKSQETARPFNIHIAVAPTKNIDRMEWFVEKAVEFGIDRITFLECRHSERVSLKIERMQRVAISAMKQSLKANLPVLEALKPFNEFILRPEQAEKFICFIDDTNPPHLLHAATAGKHACVLIGPEGDFSAQELDLALRQGYRKVSLGKSRLRTETAALAACHIINLLNL